MQAMARGPTSDTSGRGKETERHECRKQGNDLQRKLLESLDTTHDLPLFD